MRKREMWGRSGWAIYSMALFLFELERKRCGKIQYTSVWFSLPTDQFCECVVSLLLYFNLFLSLSQEEAGTRLYPCCYISIYLYPSNKGQGYIHPLSGTLYFNLFVSLWEEEAGTRLYPCTFRNLLWTQCLTIWLSGIIWMRMMRRRRTIGPLSQEQVISRERRG